MVQVSKDSQIKVERNRLIITGSGNLTKDVTKPIEVHVVTEQCDPSGDCTLSNDSTITNGCLYLEKLPFMNIGLGDSFTPRIRCPFKKGHYKFHANVTMDQFSLLPIQTKYRWRTRIMPYEVLSPNKKKLIWCIEGLFRVMASANRRQGR